MNEEEKERILNMHKDATKKQYLIENKSIINENIELINEQRAIIRKNFNKFILEPLKKVFKYGNESLLTSRKKIIRRGVEKLKNSGIMSPDGNVYVVEKIGNNPNKYELKVTKINLQDFWENNVDEFLKKDFLTSDDLKSINSKIEDKLIIRYDDYKNYETKSDAFKGTTISVENGIIKDKTNPQTKHKLPDFEELSFKSKTKSIRQDIESQKKKVRRNWVLIGLIGSFLGGLKLAFNVGSWITRTTAENNDLVLTKAQKSSNMKDLINSLCQLPITYVQGESTIVAEPSKVSNILIQLVKETNFDEVAKVFDSMKIDSFVKTLENYSEQNQNKCLIDRLWELSKKSEQEFIQKVEPSLRKMLDKGRKETQINLNNVNFFKKLPKLTIGASTSKKFTGKKLEDIPEFDFQTFKNNFMKCKCKLYDYLNEYAKQGEDIYLYVIAYNEGKDIHPLIVKYDKTKILSSYCTEENYKDLIKLVERVKNIDNVDEEAQSEIINDADDFFKSLTTQNSDKC